MIRTFAVMMYVDYHDKDVPVYYANHFPTTIDNYEEAYTWIATAKVQCKAYKKVNLTVMEITEEWIKRYWHDTTWRGPKYWERKENELSSINDNR